MTERLVKMVFQREKVADFLAVFEEVHEQIRSFPGCRYLALWQDVMDPAVIFTLSRWDSLEDLQRYRESELFRSTWSRTKALFADKPQAWSMHALKSLP
jgi:heme-degrading monooxygenase HmoA